MLLSYLLLRCFPHVLWSPVSALPSNASAPQRTLWSVAPGCGHHLAVRGQALLLPAPPPSAQVLMVTHPPAIFSPKQHSQSNSSGKLTSTFPTFFSSFRKSGEQWYLCAGAGAGGEAVRPLWSLLCSGCPGLDILYQHHHQTGQDNNLVQTNSSSMLHPQARHVHFSNLVFWVAFGGFIISLVGFFAFDTKSLFEVFLLLLLTTRISRVGRPRNGAWP